MEKELCVSKAIFVSLFIQSMKTQEQLCYDLNNLDNQGHQARKGYFSPGLEFFQEAGWIRTFQIKLKFFATTLLSLSPVWLFAEPLLKTNNFFAKIVDCFRQNSFNWSYTYCIAGSIHKYLFKLLNKYTTIQFFGKKSTFKIQFFHMTLFSISHKNTNF